MNHSFGQTAKAVGGGALLGVFCAFGLGAMAAIYSTPVINLEAVEATLGADMLGLGVTAISFPFALWLGLVAGSQQIKGHPTLKRLLWGVFLGILFSGFLVSAATTEEVVKYSALQGIEVAGGNFDSYADSSNEEWLEQHVRVSRKPWFSRPLVVVGPVLGLLLGLIVPRWLRWGKTVPSPWRSALWLVIMGLGLMPFLASPGILVVVPILGLLAVASVLIVIVSDHLIGTRRRDVRRSGKAVFLVDVAKLTGFGFLLILIATFCLFCLGSVSADFDDPQHIDAAKGNGDE